MNLQLSDGTTMQIPDDATPEAIRNFSARGEAHIKANPAPAAAAAPDDPYSGKNTIGRIATDAVLGLPDLAITASNMISRPGDKIAEWITGEKPVSRDLPTLAPMAREKLGVAELPEDAPWYRRIGEGAAAGLPYGVAGAGRAAIAGGASGGVRGGVTAGARELGKNTLLPTITSDAGAQVGGAVGGEEGAFIGGLLGGAAPSAKPMGERWVQGRYVGKGDPNAPAIAAAAERLGVEPTAGALGNYDIQKRENQYAGSYPEGLASREQQRIRGEMADVGQDIGAQRGGIGGGVAEMGDDIRTSTADRLQADRDYSSAGQENLQRDVGDRAPVQVIDIINEARAAWPHLSVPGREALEHRIQTQLMPLISQRDARGNPIIGPNTTVPYELVKQWRTELGQSFDNGRIPRNRELYGPATDAMAETAQRAGIPRGDFNDVQQFTRGVEGEGGLADRLAPYDKEPQAAYDYTLKGGLQNPDRLQTFATETAGDPRQGRVFGNYLQQLAEKLGLGGAQGARMFADVIQNADPRAINTIAGALAPRLQDLATLARGVNVPTSQTGLARSTSGVGNTLGGKFLGSEVLGQVAGAVDPMLAPAGRLAGWGARPAMDYVNQRIMQSDAAKRGMIGAPFPTQGVSIEDLLRVLNAVGQGQPPQPEREPLRITVNPR